MSGLSVGATPVASAPPAVPAGLPPADPWAPARVSRAGGLLATFNAAGLLEAGDVHVALRLGRIGGERDEAVLLAAALAVRGVRLGSVCVDLTSIARSAAAEAETAGGATATEDATAPAPEWPDPAVWPDLVRDSPLTHDGEGPGRGCPLRLVGSTLYLDRYWREETALADDLLARVAADPPDVDLERLRAAVARVLPAASADPLQRIAAAVAVLRRVSVLAGGPGTGKTTTVARLLALLHDQPGPPLRVALAAPTGKAAARLEEAVRSSAAVLPQEDQARIGRPAARTLHRLLGTIPGRSGRFRHDRDHHLPYDVVVVDETSMGSLTLMARLLEAVRPDARLVLVGDPDQLASVEAGAVLGDLCGGGSRRPVVTPALRDALAAVLPPADLAELDGGTGPAAAGPTGTGGLGAGVVVLRTVHRFHHGIAELAEAIQAGDPDAVLALLTAGRPDVEWVDTTDGVPADGLAALRADVLDAARSLTAAATAYDLTAALPALDRHRLLCAHRRGPWGVGQWSRAVETWLAESGAAASPDGFVVGQPVLMTVNDYDAGVYNGDTGVLVARPDGRLDVALARGGETVTVALARLSAVVTSYAMTVHKSQGSQFARVSVVLPPDGPLLTRELLYTAVTRAQEHVRLLAPEAAVRAAVSRPVARASGLRHRLAAPGTTAR